MGSVNPHPPSQRNSPPLINSLHKAILSNDYHGVRILIAPNKNNVDQRLEAEGATFLMVAVLLGRLKIATLLVRHDASSRAKEQCRFRAIDYPRKSLFRYKLDWYHAQMGLPAIGKK